VVKLEAIGVAVISCGVDVRYTGVVVVTSVIKYDNVGTK